MNWFKFLTVSQTNWRMFICKVAVCFVASTLLGAEPNTAPDRAAGVSIETSPYEPLHFDRLPIGAYSSSELLQCNGQGDKPLCEECQEDQRQAAKVAEGSIHAMIGELDWLGQTAPEISPVVARKIESGELPWQRLVEEAKESITSSTSSLAYFRIVRDLLSQIGDIHVGARFAAKLPVVERHIPLTFYIFKDRVYVKEVLADANVDPFGMQSDSGEQVEINSHDEVTKIDGKPAIEQLKKHAGDLFGANYPDGFLNIAAHQFLCRSSARGIEIPEQPVQLEFISRIKKTQQSLLLQWTDGHPNFNHWLWTNVPNPTPNLNFGKRIYNGVEPKSKSAKYQFKGNREIGYLKFGIFSLKSADEVKRKLTEFETSVDLAIIDLRNNTGGAVVALKQIISNLISKPVQYPNISMVLTKFYADYATEQIAEGAKLLSDLKNRDLTERERAKLSRELPIGMRNLINMLDQWNRGKKFSSTDNCDLSITPNPDFHFTKPLVILINEGSFSASQLMAAILQDSDRALVFGAPTVDNLSGHNDNVNNGKRIRGPFAITKLIIPQCDIERCPNQPEKRAQVIPDVVCHPTIGDITGETHHYNETLNQVIDCILEGLTNDQISKKFGSEYPGLSAEESPVPAVKC